MSDAQLLTAYFAKSIHPLCLRPGAELYIHQASTGRIVAKMVNPVFLQSTAELRSQYRRHQRTGETDWFMHARLTRFSVAILGEAWQIHDLPSLRWETGAAIGGPGNCGIIRAARERRDEE